MKFGKKNLDIIRESLVYRFLMNNGYPKTALMMHIEAKTVRKIFFLKKPDFSRDIPTKMNLGIWDFSRILFGRK